MGRNIEEIIAGLPKERRSRIGKASRQMAREMVAHADSLAEVRRAFSKTQTEVGAGLGMPQNAISQLEKRKDMRLSTLVRYVNALGGGTGPDHPPEGWLRDCAERNGSATQTVLVETRVSVEEPLDPPFGVHDSDHFPTEP